MTALPTTASPADTLIVRLEVVKERGPGSWVARCPAHADKSPSLSIRETADGVLLLHCFAGCSVADIVAAVGLELSDLFPLRLDEPHTKPQRKPPIPWPDLITALRHALMVVIVATSDLAKGKALSPEDLATLQKAAVTIKTVLEVARHG